MPVAAIALGACIVEKHFTLSRATLGPDSTFSLEPAEFEAMVAAIRTTERALGRVNYEVSANEAKSRQFRRSLFVVADVKAAEALLVIGESKRDPMLPLAEHAALTATCLALYNLDAAITRD